jgi:hypothetical protein
LARTAFLARVVIAVTSTLGLLLISWGWDAHNDRAHTVTVNSKTPVFAGDGQCFDGQQLLDLPSGTNLKVRRIRYLKDCATLKVALPDGRQGYIIFGDGGFSVNPPL